MTIDGPVSQLNMCVCKWRDWDLLRETDMSTNWPLLSHYLSCQSVPNWLTECIFHGIQRAPFCCDYGFPMKRNLQSTVQRIVVFAFNFSFILHSIYMCIKHSIYIYTHNFRWSKNVSHIHQPTAINASCIHWRWSAIRGFRIYCAHALTRVQSFVQQTHNKKYEI